jgi:hypothetical protein
MRRNILLGAISILFISINSLTAQLIKGGIGYSNIVGDSIRFSICRNVIDTLMIDRRVDKLILRYDGSSDYYEVNNENVRSIRYSKVKTDSSIIADFNNSLRLKFRDIQTVSIDSIGAQSVSFLEESYFFSRSANIIYILLQEPLEGWEPLKIPTYCFLYGFTNSRFVNVMRDYPFYLNIPVRVIYNDGKGPKINCYLFKYKIVLDQTKKLPGWNLENKTLLY